MSETVFEKILSGELPADFVYEDDKVVAFKDLYPQAKIHLLFIHREKTSHVNEMMQKSESQLLDLFRAINRYVEQHNLTEKGFRIVTNCGKEGGQTVFYTHFHLLAGEQLASFGRS